MPYLFRALVPIFAMALLPFDPTSVAGQQTEIMVRVSEIEIVSSYLDQYKAILKEEAAASVRLEPGVIAIFPMYQKESLKLVDMAVVDAETMSRMFRKTP